MLRHFVLFGFAALWISFAVAEAPATLIEPAKPVNIESLKDEAKETSDDLETDATSWGGYYNGWGGNGNGHYGGSWNVRPWYGGGWGWGSGWGGRGYGGGWNRGWGWGGRGYGGWGGYRGGYWG